jgi:Uncharacterised nucleotidyltransferase
MEKVGTLRIFDPAMLGKEEQLLLACSQSSMDGEAILGARAILAQGIDWTRLLKMSDRLKVLLLVTYNLRRHLSDVLPRAEMGRINRIVARSVAHSLFALRQIDDLLLLLNAEGISAIPFKGPVFAGAFYGNVGLRESEDIDLLVSPQDAQKASSLLISVGYQPEFRLSSLQERALIRFCNSHTFSNEEKETSVDLHWGLVPVFFPVEIEEVWSHCQQVNVEGRAYNTLSGEDYFLYLFSHGLQHDWEVLSLVCDVAEALRANDSLNWDYILRNASEAQKEHILFLGPVLAADLLQAPAPLEVLEEARRYPAVRELAREVTGRWFSEEPNSASVNVLGRLAWKALEGLRYQGRLLAHWVFIPTGLECQMITFPRVLFGLYYPVRLLRLLLKHGPLILGKTK